MRMPKKILIVRMDRMGDLLLSTPAIRAVRKGAPDAYVAVMVRPYTVDIVKDNPDVDEIIVYDKEGKEKGVIGNLKFVTKLFLKRFDTAVILHTTNRAVLLTLLAGIGSRIGYDRRLKYLLTKPLKCDKHLGKKHEVDYCLDIVQATGIDTEGADRKPVLKIFSDDIKTANDLLSKKGVKESDRLICFNPGASCRSRMWRKKRYREVVNHFLRTGKYRIVFIGSGQDAEIVSEIISGIEMRVINLAGVLSIGETAAVLSKAMLLVSNDTGPVHIASAIGIPVVVIYGRKNPGLGPVVWGPIGENNIILHKDAGCGTCLAHNCENSYKCLDLVSTGDVIEAAEKLLRETIR